MATLTTPDQAAIEAELADTVLAIRHATDAEHDAIRAYQDQLLDDWLQTGTLRPSRVLADLA